MPGEDIGSASAMQVGIKLWRIGTRYQPGPLGTKRVVSGSKSTWRLAQTSAPQPWCWVQKPGQPQSPRGTQRQKADSSHTDLVVMPTGELPAPGLEKAIICDSWKECWNCPRAQRSSNSGTGQGWVLSETPAASGRWVGSFLYRTQQCCNDSRGPQRRQWCPNRQGTESTGGKNQAWAQQGATGKKLATNTVPSACDTVTGDEETSGILSLPQSTGIPSAGMRRWTRIQPPASFSSFSCDSFLENKSQDAKAGCSAEGTETQGSSDLWEQELEGEELGPPAAAQQGRTVPAARSDFVFCLEITKAGILDSGWRVGIAGGPKYPKYSAGKRNLPEEASSGGNTESMQTDRLQPPLNFHSVYLDAAGLSSALLSAFPSLDKILTLHVKRQCESQRANAGCLHPCLSTSGPELWHDQQSLLLRSGSPPLWTGHSRGGPIKPVWALQALTAGPSPPTLSSFPGRLLGSSSARLPGQSLSPPWLPGRGDSCPSTRRLGSRNYPGLSTLRSSGLCRLWWLLQK